MSEINSSNYSTQYYVTGIRATPTGQTEAGKATATDWTAATNAISTATATGANKTQADLEKLVETYQHLYSAVLDGATVSKDLKTNTDAFAAEFQKLFASLGSDTVKNSPKSQFLMVLGNLVQEQKTGTLSGYQQFISQINQANLTSGPSEWERMLSVGLVSVAAGQSLYEAGTNLQAINFTNEMASRELEIEEDKKAAEAKFEASNIKAGAQIAAGAVQVGMAGVAAKNAANASKLKVQHQQQAAQAGNAQAADATLDAYKKATAYSEGASGMGQGTSSMIQGVGGLIAADQERNADLAGTRAKGHSRDATGASDQSKAAERMCDSLAQSTGKILSDVQDNVRANLQSMSNATRV